MSAPREGWNVPRPERIPRPTAWPAGMALGITLFAWGLITSPVVLGLGLTMFAASLAGWIGEIRHEHRQG
ncbi:MAG: cytochrome c oxidase subunit 4 [Polyangiaceae bacterium]